MLFNIKSVCSFEIIVSFDADVLLIMSQSLTYWIIESAYTSNTSHDSAEITAVQQTHNAYKILNKKLNVIQIQSCEKSYLTEHRIMLFMSRTVQGNQMVNDCATLQLIGALLLLK